MLWIPWVPLRNLPLSILPRKFWQAAAFRVYKAFHETVVLVLIPQDYYCYY